MDVSLYIVNMTSYLFARRRRRRRPAPLRKRPRLLILIPYTLPISNKLLPPINHRLEMRISHQDLAWADSAFLYVFFGVEARECDGGLERYSGGENSASVYE